MSTIPESIIGMLRKVAALAERGEGGEAVAARRRLDHLLEKYGLSLDQIAEPVKRRYAITYSSKMERRLLMQVVCFVLVDIRGVKYGEKKRAYVFELTPEQYVDICELYGHYKRELNDEIERLFKAFIIRHRLTAKETGGQSEPMDLGELRKLLDLISGMSSQTKQLSRKALKE